MCGIICLIQCGGKKIDLAKARECMNFLKARGPDKTSDKIIEINEMVEVFMGFTRLAIMDTSDAGLQPFTNGTGDIVVCNGGIYNYKQLAKTHGIEITSECDCEILLPLFKKMGFEAMISKELDAEFAMTFFDKLENKIYVARDRYGVRPLYYGYNHTTKMLGFASELKALHPLMEFVEQVVPNQIISIDLSQKNDSNLDFDVTSLVTNKSYYSFSDACEHNLPLITMSTEIIRERINFLLTEAVKKRLYSDRPIGFLLSGGLDSSVIVSIATKILGPDNIVCFSIGIEGSPDVEAAKKVVKYLGIQNHHIIPFSIKQGLEELHNVIKATETYDITTIRASTPQYIMAKYIKENTNIKVLLSGEGSDEIHGSYRYFRDAPDFVQFHNETIRLLQELCYFDNQRTDRTMANWGLEVRVPFLDFDYVDFITKIDPQLLMYKHDYMEKMIVRDSFKSYLPDEILYRSKEAFSDAVSNSENNWAKSIQILADSKISNEELENNNFSINKPRTKDALYFRNIFESIYPARDNIIPHYWLPKFQKEEILDPSATILQCY